MRVLRWVTTLPLRLRTLILKSRVEQELDEELQFHLESQVEQLISRGYSSKEARTMALKAMGGVDRQKERCREVRAGQWLRLLGADAAFSWRQLMKRKVTTAAAILSLGLAIGACTSAFRLIDALFLRPMPVSHPERLYAVFRFGKGFSDGKPRAETSYEYPVFQQMRAAVKNEAEVVAVSFANRTDLTYVIRYGRGDARDDLRGRLRREPAPHVRFDTRVGSAATSWTGRATARWRSWPTSSSASR